MIFRIFTLVLICTISVFFAACGGTAHKQQRIEQQTGKRRGA